ncbi:tr [Leptolyngbya sp. Heron Island J]|uniref:hypothetical protein n=1 Tax=Leptolyngbya sp. Heron Island J TaxID=1385935 RepID=UPI0003B94D4F|nr:hypothetical protein [Leptolyngbya sp. Heron Island J]ESA37196.1 tr [Leptolyngbya sp. Heron Island J]
MQLLIFSGYHSPDLTHAFLQSLLRVTTPERLWVLPIWAAPVALPWLLSSRQAPRRDCLLQVIAFSAGVVAAYPLLLAWQRLGGNCRLIAVDGWGMPLPGNLTIYRISHDRWTHRTTYFPTAAESQGYFYAQPAVDHLQLWRSPDVATGIGSLGATTCSMTAIEFISAVLTSD